MTPGQHIERSKKRLAEAETLLRNKLPEGACNRAYYAAYEAMLATLAATGVSTASSHKGNRVLFYQHVVNAGRIKRDVAAAIGRTEEARLLADYTGENIRADAAETAVSQAREFVAAVEKILASSTKTGA